MRAKLRKSYLVAYCASNKMLSLMGEFDADIIMPSTNRSGVGTIAVAANSKLNLFGLDLHHRFGLDDEPVSKICGAIQEAATKESMSEALKKEFPRVFEKRLN